MGNRGGWMLALSAAGIGLAPAGVRAQDPPARVEMSAGRQSGPGAGGEEHAGTTLEALAPSSLGEEVSDGVEGPVGSGADRELPQTGLWVQVALGASREVRAFALDVRGGRPFAPALAEIQVAGRALRCTLLLDAAGAARRVVMGLHPDVGSAVQAWAGGSTAEVLHAHATAPAPLPPLAAVSSADFVITEFMKDPAFVPDTQGEWIEVHNRSAAPLDIEGWSLRDAGSNQHVIDVGGAGLVIPSGGYLLLGNNDVLATNGGVHVAYRYSNFVLGNGADAIWILDSTGSLRDAVDYDDGILWPDLSGRSIYLGQPATSSTGNDFPGNWCPGMSAMGWSTDMGTPGRPNGLCP